VTSTTAISVSGQQQQVNTPMSRQSHDGTNTTNASLMVVAAQNKTGQQQHVNKNATISVIPGQQHSNASTGKKKKKVKQKQNAATEPRFSVVQEHDVQVSETAATEILADARLSNKFNCSNLKREQEYGLKLKFQFASHRVERVIKDELQTLKVESIMTGKLKGKLDAPDFIPSKPSCGTCLHHLDTPPNTVEEHIGTSKAGAIWMKIATRSNKEAIVRRLPMRVAKQKQAAPTTSTRSNRSKKK